MFFKRKYLVQHSLTSLQVRMNCVVLQNVHTPYRRYYLVWIPSPAPLAFKFWLLRPSTLLKFPMDSFWNCALFFLCIMLMKWSKKMRLCGPFLLVLHEIQNHDCPTDGATEERELDGVCVANGAVMITCEWRCCLIGNTRTSSPRKRLSSSASVREITCYKLHINSLVVNIKLYRLLYWYKNSILLNSFLCTPP